MSDEKKFDQIKYQNQWIQSRYAKVGGSYPKKFVNDFKDACKKIGCTQSEVFRKAMEEVIEKASQK